MSESDQARNLREFGWDAGRPNLDFQTERLVRARQKMAPEYHEYLAPADPASIPKPPPLTKSQEKDWLMVMAAAFPSR